jgi:phosphomannomutase/phosphoglucomutase
MFPKPRQDLRPNTAEFERLPFVKATGFREYDARWRYPEEINLLGLEAVGMALVDLMRARGVPPRIVVGHDYRSYSASIKAALINGLLAGGAEVHDIGLALSPTPSSSLASKASPWSRPATTTMAGPASRWASSGRSPSRPTI